MEGAPDRAALVPFDASGPWTVARLFGALAAGCDVVLGPPGPLGKDEVEDLDALLGGRRVACLGPAEPFEPLGADVVAVDPPASLTAAPPRGRVEGIITGARDRFVGVYSSGTSGQRTLWLHSVDRLAAKATSVAGAYTAGGPRTVAARYAALARKVGGSGLRSLARGALVCAVPTTTIGAVQLLFQAVHQRRLILFGEPVPLLERLARDGRGRAAVVAAMAATGPHLAQLLGETPSLAPALLVLAGGRADGFSAPDLESSCRMSVTNPYGLSEAGGAALSDRGVTDWSRVSGAIGSPLPDVEVRLRSPSDAALAAQGFGELLLRSTCQAVARVRGGARPVAPNDWLETGDLVQAAPGGYEHVGRTDLSFLRGGVVVDPSHLEERVWAMGYPGATCCGLPYPRIGHIVALRIDGDTAADVDEVGRLVVANALPIDAVVATDAPRGVAVGLARRDFQSRLRAGELRGAATWIRPGLRRPLLAPFLSEQAVG